MVRTAVAACAIYVALWGANLFGQGCIVARSSSVNGGPESEGGYLSPGEFQFTTGLRHQFSFKHFVGDVEQKQRVSKALKSKTRSTC